MISVDWKQDRPTLKESRRIWQGPVFERLETSFPAVEELLAQLRKAMANGGAEFAAFSIRENAHLDWFLSRNRDQEIDFFENLVRSNAFQGELPSKQRAFEQLTIEWAWSSSYVLDGEIAFSLMVGGAYERFSGTGEDAKDLGRRASSELVGTSYEDVLVQKTHTAWSDWFHGIAWDCTWLGIDKRKRIAWVLRYTDTD